MTMAVSSPYVSVIVPVWNRQRQVAVAAEKILDALDESFDLYELIFVDDGSSDSSFREIEAAAKSNERIRGVRLARNFGQHAALSAGLEKARGDVLVSFDADLQCDPRDIPKLVHKVLEGYGVASGWRFGRADKWTRKIPSFFMNKLINFYTGVRLHDHGCAFKAISREVADQVPQQGDMRRFLTALVLNLTPRVAEVKVSHRQLDKEKSTYDFWKLFDLAVDFLTGYSRKPFRIVGLLGSLLTSVGIVGSILCLAGRFFHSFFREPRLQVIVAACVVVGFQFLTLWLIGEFSARTYQLLQSPPLFAIAETVNLGTEEKDGSG